MRLPTPEEMSAFAAEEEHLHDSCEKLGTCIHQKQAVDLDEMLKSTHIVKGLVLICIRDNPRCFPMRAELRYCTVYGFLLGMMLGFKLAEQDRLEDIMCGSGE